MKKVNDSKSMLIFVLLAIPLIMVVGFAAFSTALQINGTANISTSWCVGFDNTKTNTYQITKGNSAGTNPSATMGYSGTACSSTYVPIANIGTTYNSCAATGQNVCLRYTIENDIVTGAEACFIKGGNEYCLTGWVNESSLETTPVYDANVLTLQTAFTETNACSDYGSSYDCGVSGLSSDAYSTGTVDAYGGSWNCVFEYDSAYCYED